MESLGRWQHGEARGRDLGQVRHRTQVPRGRRARAERSRPGARREKRQRPKREGRARETWRRSPRARGKAPPLRLRRLPSASLGRVTSALINPRVARACACGGARRVVARSRGERCGSRIVGGRESRPAPLGAGASDPARRSPSGRRVRVRRDVKAGARERRARRQRPCGRPSSSGAPP